MATGRTLANAAVDMNATEAVPSEVIMAVIDNTAARPAVKVVATGVIMPGLHKTPIPHRDMKKEPEIMKSQWLAILREAVSSMGVVILREATMFHLHLIEISTLRKVSSAVRLEGNWRRFKTPC